MDHPSIPRKASRTLVSGILLVVAGCADPHFFPRLRPLFVGLDEASVPVEARPVLAQAKTDFRRARRREAPRFAVFSGFSSHPKGKVYTGKGYRITEVHDEGVNSWLDGLEITLDSSITGRAPFHYSEGDRNSQ